MQIIRNSIAVLAAAALAACASTTPVGGGPGVSVAPTTGMPSPDLTDYMPDVESRLIRPLDVIQVDVFDIPELTREVQISETGSLDFPLIEPFQAIGLSTEELAGILEDRLRASYVRNPDVTARIIARSEMLFTVGGEVGTPGRFPITQPVTLMEAVAIGGGMAEFADQQEVLIFRTVGDQRYIGVYNLQGIQRGNYADPMVYPNDIVMVGDSPGRRRLQSILELTAAITAPLILVERVLR